MNNIICAPSNISEAALSHMSATEKATASAALRANIGKLPVDEIPPQVILELAEVMAFGAKKSPIIQQIGKKTAVAVRLGGMGVAIGWQVGKEVSELLSDL